jgi:G:T-mismatch repair DNA endonuclease (very short patch repair protein)
MDRRAKKEKSESMMGENNHMHNKTVYNVWLVKYGKDVADEKWDLFLEKMSSISKGENNPMYGKHVYDIWVEKYGEEVANKKLSILNKKRSDWLKNNPMQHKKMILNSLKRAYKKTSIEKEVEKYLIENEINFKYNFIDKYQYDFLLKDLNIIIEVQGDYWHGNPLYYSNDNKLKQLNEVQLYKQKLDKEKYEYIKDRYDIIYLWETDIKNKKYKETLWNLLKLKK